MEAVAERVRVNNHNHILIDLLKRELSEVKEQIKWIAEEIARLEDKYGVDSETFLSIWDRVVKRDFNDGVDDLARWRMLLDLREKLQDKLDALEEMLEGLS